MRQDAFEFILIQTFALKIASVATFVLVVMGAIKGIIRFMIKIGKVIRDGGVAHEGQKHHGEQHRVFRKVFMLFVERFVQLLAELFRLLSKFEKLIPLPAPC